MSCCQFCPCNPLAIQSGNCFDYCVCTTKVTLAPPAVLTGEVKGYASAYGDKLRFPPRPYLASVFDTYDYFINVITRYS